jgi:hypothetical protein
MDRALPTVGGTVNLQFVATGTVERTIFMTGDKTLGFSHREFAYNNATNQRRS